MKSDKTQSRTSGRRQEAESTQIWDLRLYVAGWTPCGATAQANLKKICEQHIAGKYHIEVIDLLENPQLARRDQILAVPTLVRKFPTPVREIIGDLSNTERVLVGLGLRPSSVQQCERQANERKEDFRQSP